ncbi:MAG TPA: carboxypeptidase-like regulatory domain-containing protein [Pyrinomonadaceae bacterium]|nr:carboxypeptidase-like regulatory domain-containing protein [Pyrinomonadaceae bacterium]
MTRYLFAVNSPVTGAMKSLSFALLLTCLFAISGLAQQTTGSLTGTVTDPSGAVVPGATVKAVNNATGAERSAESNSSGTFDLQALQPGTYTVTIDAKGFKRAVSRDIIVSVTTVAQVTIPLEVGQANETVTVSAAQEVINTTTPSVTNVINTRQVVDLPLGNRDPTQLAGLQAGIAVTDVNVRGSSISGLRQTAVNMTQDGINAMDNFVKTSSVFAITTPSLNSTSEFSITTGTVSADSGRGAAQINLVTKGGTNDFHGHAFLQIINNWTDANVWFNQAIAAAKPILRQHYDGFDIGGPAFGPRFGEGGKSYWNGKDKAFFFFSYERFVQSDSRTRNRSVLTQSALNGSYTYTPNCTTSNPCPAGVVSGVPRTINLLTQGSVPFHTLDPVMTAHLAQIPLPNNSTCSSADAGGNISCFQFNANQLTTNDKYVVRYDHQLFKNRSFGSHKLEFVFSRVLTRTFPDVTTNALEAPFPGGVNGFQASTRNLVTPALVSTFGNNVTNVFRFGRQWAPVDFNRDKPQTVPFISLPGVLTNYDNTFLPQPRNTIVNQATDTLSWVKGNHLWKGGMDWQNVLGISRNDAGIVQLNQLGTNNANQSGLTVAQTGNLPGASSAQLTAANTVYTAIVGLLGSASQTLNVQTPTSGFVPGYTRLRLVQEKDLALFVQDQWRMKSNFTLSYGVRWDYMGVPTVPNGLAIQPTNFASIWGVSGQGNLFQPTAAAGSQTAGVATLDFVSGKTGKGLYKNDWNNFAPFVGFAYSPSFKSGLLHSFFGDEGTTSIRAGYSVSYLHDGVTTFTNLLGTGNTNPGLIQTANTSPLSGVTPNTNLILGQLTAAGVPLNFPAFLMPITDRQNFLVNTAAGLWTADPNLRAPYVHQWNFGIEKEIFKNTAFEARYVGNYAPNTWRALNINEVNIFENGFLNEFKNAQINFAARGGTSFAPGCAGCVALPLFDKFFGVVAGGTVVAATSAYTSATFLANLRDNNVGALANTLAFSSTYKANRESTAPGYGLAGNFFVANPNAAFVNILTNDSKSNYNAMELELRRRFSNGLQFQADYTWSKAMGDATDAQGNNQSDLVSRLSLRFPKTADYRRSPQDQTQRFIANGIYDLPFGKGKKFFGGANDLVDRVVGGFNIGVIGTWATGAPFYVASGRSTFNSSTANNGAQLTGITFQDFKKNLGVFKTPTGVYFVNPSLLDITVSPTTGQATQATLKAGLMAAPAPGTLGNFPINSLDGPSYFDVDLSITKRLRITERVRFELKGTALNLLNHPAFTYGTLNFDSTSFGRITTQRGTSRQMNIIAQVTF